MNIKINYNPTILIVVSTNSDTKTLQKCIYNFDRFTDYKKYNIKILLCDTFSIKNPSHIDYIKSLPPKYLKWFSPKPCYQPGAYSYAFNNIKSDLYFFCQDTTWPTSSDWVNQALEKDPYNNVLVYFSYDINIGFLSDKRTQIFNKVKKPYILEKIPKLQMFATQTFMCSHNHIHTVSNKFNITGVNTKLEANYYEHAWGIYFHECNIPVIEMERIKNQPFPNTKNFYHSMVYERINRRPT